MTKHLDVPELSTRIVIISASRAETDQHYCFYKIALVYNENKIDKFDPFLFRKTETQSFGTRGHLVLRQLSSFRCRARFLLFIIYQLPQARKGRKAKQPSVRILPCRMQLSCQRIVFRATNPVLWAIWVLTIWNLKAQKVSFFNFWDLNPPRPGIQVKVNFQNRRFISSSWSSSATLLEIQIFRRSKR